MGCCGGRAKSRTTPAIAAPTVAAAARAANAAFATNDGLVKLAYYGTRRGDFRVASGVTRTLYRIPGPGMLVEKSGTGKQGVLAADVPWFMSVNAGRDFRIVQEPKLAQPTPIAATQRTPVAVKPALVESKAWAPEVMEEKAIEPVEPVGEEIKSAEEEPGDTAKARRTRRK